MSVAQFVAGVDRLLTRGHGLFPAGAPGDGGQVFAAGGGGGSVPGAPAGGDSGLAGGAAAAGGGYQQAQAGATGLDGDAGQAVTEGGAVGAQGRAASGLIRDQARAVGAASAALGRSPAGAQLVMAAMDQHLEAMQRQLDQTTAQNRLLALRLRELAGGYRGIGSAGMGGMPLSGLGGVHVGRRPQRAERPCGHFQVRCWAAVWAADRRSGVRLILGAVRRWVLPVLLEALSRCRRFLLKAKGFGLVAAARCAAIWKKRWTGWGSPTRGPGRTGLKV